MERKLLNTMDESQQEDTDALKARTSHPLIANFIQSMAEWGFNYHDNTLLWDAMCLIVEADEKGDIDFADDQIKIFYDGIYTNDDEDDEREGQEIMSYSHVSKKDYQEYYEDTKWNPCACDVRGCLSCFLYKYPHTPEIKNGGIVSYGSLWFQDEALNLTYP